MKGRVHNDPIPYIVGNPVVCLTPAGAAYVRCLQAEGNLVDACGSVQCGGDTSGMAEFTEAQNNAVQTFRNLTGRDFYPTR